MKKNSYMVYGWEAEIFTTTPLLSKDKRVFQSCFFSRVYNLCYLQNRELKAAVPILKTAYCTSHWLLRQCNLVLFLLSEWVCLWALFSLTIWLLDPYKTKLMDMVKMLSFIINNNNKETNCKVEWKVPALLGLG